MGFAEIIMLTLIFGLPLLVLWWGINRLMLQNDPVFKEILLKNMEIAIKSGSTGWGGQQLIYQKSHIEYKIIKNKQ